MVMTSKAQSAEVVGQVYKVQTLVDGGIRVTIDLPETAINEMAKLAQFQINGTAIRILIEPDSRSANK